MNNQLLLIINDAMTFFPLMSLGLLVLLAILVFFALEFSIAIFDEIWKEFHKGIK